MNRRDHLTLIMGAFLPASSVGVAALFQVGPFRPVAPVVDPHPELLVRWRQLRADWYAALDEYGDETEASELLWQQRLEVIALLAHTKPQTDRGRLAQVQWLIEDAEGDYCYPDHEAAMISLRDSLAQKVGAQ